MKQKAKGFTLIELMITVAIIGIISAIAYPSYVEQVKKAHRTDAQGALMSLSGTVERFYTQNNTFVGAPTAVTIEHYDIDSALTATTYTLQLKPKADQAQDGDGCLELLSVGTRNHYPADDCTGTPTTW